MPQINSLSQRDAVALASKMRNQIRNAKMENARYLQYGTRIGGALVGSYFAGSYMGGLEQEYQANAAAIDAQEMPDPRQLAGIDMELVIGGGALLLGLVGQGILGDGKNAVAKSLGLAASGIEGVGLGVLSGYMYSMGQTAGQEAALESA